MTQEWYEKTIEHLNAMARDLKFRSGAHLERACALSLRDTLTKELTEMRRLGLTSF